MESRTQGWRTALPRTDPLEAKDTGPSVFRKSKFFFKTIFQAISKKTTFSNIFFRLTEVESRTQGSRPRTALPRTDPLEAKDTDQAQVFSEKESFFSSKRFFRRSKKKKFSNIQAKKVLKIFFSSNLQLRKTKKWSLQIFREAFAVFQQNFNG